MNKTFCSSISTWSNTVNLKYLIVAVYSNICFLYYTVTALSRFVKG